MQEQYKARADKFAALKHRETDFNFLTSLHAQIEVLTAALEEAEGDLETAKKEIEFLKLTITTLFDRPTTTTTTTTGWEDVKGVWDSQRPATCGSCRATFSVPIGAMVVETCPHCGHTNLPF